MSCLTYKTKRRKWGQGRGQRKGGGAERKVGGRRGGGDSTRTRKLYYSRIVALGPFGPNSQSLLYGKHEKHDYTTDTIKYE